MTPRRKKTEDQIDRAMRLINENIRQLKSKKGPNYELWKSRMDAWRERERIRKQWEKDRT